MRRKFEMEIHVVNRWFTVKGDYYPGFAGNWDNPPEAPDVDFTSVVQFFDDNEEPWEKDEMFIDEKPDIWLFVEQYEPVFYDAVCDQMEEGDYYGDGDC